MTHVEQGVALALIGVVMLALPVSGIQACGAFGAAETKDEAEGGDPADGRDESTPDSTPDLCPTTVQAGVGPVNAVPKGLVTCGAGQVELLSNPKHCGECFHDCGEGFQCADGICDVETVDLPARPGVASRALALDDAALYWSWQETHSASPDTGVLQRKPFDGTPSTELASDPRLIIRGAIDGSSVYFVAEGVPIAVQVVPRGGGTARPIATLAEAPDLAVTAGAVFVTAARQNQVFRIGNDGGSPVPISTQDPAPADLLADGAHLYWTSASDGGAGHVTRYDVDGGFIAYSSQVDSPRGLAADARWLYVYDERAKNVVRLSKSELEAPPQVIASVNLPGTSFALPGHVDDSALYLPIARTASADDAVLLKIPKCGGAPRILANSMFQFRVLGDRDFVYFGMLAGGKLVRLRK